jgi:cytoskeleton protein RodZ
MSEDDLNSADRAAPAADPVAAEPPSSFGARLAWEREKAGLTVTDIAARLRLHPKQVRAIEQEHLDELPEAAYVRGFVRSYAKIVGIDATPLLADLNDRIAPPAGSVVDGMTANGDYSPVRAAARETASRQIVIGLAVVGMIALGVIGWYSTREQARPVVIKASPPAPAPAQAPAMPADGVPATPAAISDAATTAEQDAPAEPEVPARKSLLKMKFSGPSWIEVTDGGGRVLVSQHKAAGDEVLLDGNPPFSVVIGDASKATVEVRGEEFSLTPVTRTNVARFVVK